MGTVDARKASRHSWKNAPRVVAERDRGLADMARRALIVGTGVADRIAAGLSGWEIERNPARVIDLVVWANHPAAACTPRRLTDLSLAEWDEA